MQFPPTFRAKNAFPLHPPTSDAAVPVAWQLPSGNAVEKKKEGESRANNPVFCF